MYGNASGSVLEAKSKDEVLTKTLNAALTQVAQSGDSCRVHVTGCSRREPFLIQDYLVSPHPMIVRDRICIHCVKSKRTSSRHSSLNSFYQSYPFWLQARHALILQTTHSQMNQCGPDLQKEHFHWRRLVSDLMVVQL